MLRKLACNATNSAAIDVKGNVYVWGAGKYGLLGNPKQKNSIPKPIMLQLKSDNNDGGGGAGRSDEQTFVATCISFGQYHGAVVVNDSSTNSDFVALTYAKQILSQFYAYLLNRWEFQVKKKYQQSGAEGQESQNKDTIIELTLQDCFTSQDKLYPYISLSSLKTLMVEEANLSFNDTVAYNRFFSDLSIEYTEVGISKSEMISKNDKFIINLKELRDQLLGRRCGNGIVFTWGICNDGRLGLQNSHELLSQQEDEELFAVRPSIVKFPSSNIIIAKVSCGLTFTLALQAEQGFVYSWGLGTSGGLGQGEISQSWQPSRIVMDKSGRQFQNIKDIASGANHCLALEGNGMLYSWGNGQGGRLGHGDETGENLPKEISFFRLNSLKVLIIEAGESNSAAVTSKNELLIWGIGLHGRLGTGRTHNLYSPSYLDDMQNIKVEDISLGSNHTLCILRNGKTMCWGSSKEGKIGLESALDRNFLVPRELITLEKEKISQMVAGPFHSLALTENGTLYAFGSAKDGKLGFEDAKQNILIPKKLVNSNVSFYKKWNADNDRNERFPIFGDYDETFVHIAPNSDNSIPSGLIQAQCSFNSTFMLLNDGTLLTCGSNKYGQLGVTNFKECLSFEKRARDNNDPIDIAESKRADMAEIPISDLLSHGSSSDSSEDSNENNQGKDNSESSDNEELKKNKEGATPEDHLIPAPLRKKLEELKKQKDIEVPQHLKIVHDAVQMKIRHISAGSHHVFAVTTEGITFGWGRNDFGQLGIGTKKDSAVFKPVFLRHLQDKKIVMTAAGDAHSLFLTDLGEVYSCGFNEYGELGIGEMTNIAGGNNYDDDENQNSTPISNPQEQTQRQSVNIQDIHQIILDTKIEVFPKLVQGLEFIGFITAGKNHSIAIRTHKRKQKELQMYSWGCGWYGQTGQGQSNNIVSPKLLKCSAQRDVKFMMASGGAKHTLAIDTSGDLWFFGQKSSIGIKNDADNFDENNDKQMQPIKLQWPPFHKQEPFKFVTCGEDHNFAITFSGRIFGFGINKPFSKISKSSKNLMYFELLDQEERFNYASCGSQHSIIVDNKFSMPFTWGNSQNGRLGQSSDIEFDKNDQESEQMFSQILEKLKESDEPSPLPLVWFALIKANKQFMDMKRREKIFLGGDKKNGNQKSINQGLIQEESKGDGGANREKLPDIKFPIQKILKENPIAFDEDNLILQDRNLESMFGRLQEEFHQILSEKNEQLLNNIYTAQNSIVSRILTMPQVPQNGLGGIQLVTDIKAELPKQIIRNKQIFEAIFNLLQNHPCYLVNWITKTTINRQPKEVVHLLKAVFDEREIRNNSRVVHILMIIARKQLVSEMSKFDLKEILWGRTEQTFVSIFNLIFESQDQNRKFVKHIICSFFRKLQKFIIQFKEKNNRFGLTVNESQFCTLFDFEAQQSSDQNEKRARWLIQFIEENCIQKILKALDPQYKTKNGAFLSDEIFTLLHLVRSEITQKNQTMNKGSGVPTIDIDIYIGGIVMDIVISKMRECDSINKLETIYWNVKQKGKNQGKKENNKPNPNIFVLNSVLSEGSNKNMVVNQVCTYLERYLKKNIFFNQQSPAVELVKNFIIQNNNNRKDYRTELSKLLCIQIQPVDDLLLKDLFLNSMELKDKNLNITVADLIYVYNSLVEKQELILVEGFVNKEDQSSEELTERSENAGQIEEDPMYILLEALGMKSIEIKRGEKELISPEVLQFKLNLEIRCRMLIQHDQFVRCHECWTPVYEDLIPETRFNDAVEGKQWVCASQSCRYSQNDRKSIKCARCQIYKEIKSLPLDMVFPKFRRPAKDQSVEIFKRILIYLPIVDNNQQGGINEILNYEEKVEGQKKNPDYEKLQYLSKFKQIQQKNREKLNLGNVLEENNEQQDHILLQISQAEEEFLGTLNSELTATYHHLKQHQDSLQTHQRLLKDIQEKLYNSYTQRHQQTCQEFQIISNNSYSGQGSDFLHDFENIPEVLSGKLHIKAKIKSEKKESKKKKKASQASGAKLDDFFSQLDQGGTKGDDIKGIEPKTIKKQEFKSNFGFYGKYPIHQLQQKGILINLTMEGKKLDSIIKKTSYVFYDDGDHGFRVELIFEESDTKCIVFVTAPNEAILETFNIHKHMLAEMRRTFSTKTTINFGNSEFSVFHLVFLLNEIKSKIYAYSIANKPKEDDKSRQQKYLEGGDQQ